MTTIPQQFPGVTALTKANIYFDGKVVSHTLLLPDGSKKIATIRQDSWFRVEDVEKR